MSQFDGNLYFDQTGYRRPGDVQSEAPKNSSYFATGQRGTTQDVSRREGLPHTRTETLRMDGPTGEETNEFTTNLARGFLEIQDGYVAAIHAVPCLANWDFYKTNTLPMQPPVRAVQKDGIKRLIIYDDPEELPYEAKVFE